jgi:hypothetical protein
LPVSPAAGCNVTEAGAFCGILQKNQNLISGEEKNKQITSK